MLYTIQLSTSINLAVLLLLLVLNSCSLNKVATFSQVCQSPSCLFKPEFSERNKYAQLKLENLDDSLSSTVYLTNPKFVNTRSNSDLIKSITNKNMSDEEKAITIWEFVCKWRHHCTPLTESSHDLHDPVKLINIFGCGYCDDAAAVVANLAQLGELKSRVWSLDGHVVAEIFYDDAWHMFDSDHEVYYRNEHGIVSVSFLSENPKFHRANSKSTKDKRSSKYYVSTENNSVSEWWLNRQSNHLMDTKLYPGDVLIFRSKRQGYLNRIKYYNEDYRYYDNCGYLIRKLDSNNANVNLSNNVIVFRESTAYALTSASVNMDSEHSEMSDIRIYLSLDGNVWEHIGTLTSDSTEIQLDPFNNTGENIVYDYYLKFETVTKPDISSVLNNIRVKNEFMFSNRPIPYPQANGAEILLNVMSEDITASPEIKLTLISSNKKIND